MPALGLGLALALSGKTLGISIFDANTLVLNGDALALNGEELYLNAEEDELLIGITQLNNGDVTAAAAQGTDVATLSATGGLAPYVYTLSGTDPSYFQVNGSTLETSATPIAGTIRYVTVTVTDALFATSAETLAFTVAADTDPGTVPPGTIEQDPNFDGTVTSSNVNGGVKFKGKTTGEAKFVYRLGTPGVGHEYIVKVDPDFTLLSNTGKNAFLGFYFKTGTDFHFVGLQGDGLTGLKTTRLHGTTFNSAPTAIVGSAPTNGTQAGPNWLRLEISADGTEYLFQTSANGTVWATELTGITPTPLATPASAADFGIAVYMAANDLGPFSVHITEWNAVRPVTYIAGGQFYGAFADVTIDLDLISGWVAGDTAILIQSSENRVTAPTGQTWNLIGSVGQGTVGGSTGTAIAAYWREPTPNEANTTVNTVSGDHTINTVLFFRNCKVGDPINVVSTPTAHAGNTVITCGGVTTDVAKCLALALIVSNADINGATFSNWVCAALASVAEFSNFGWSGGNGGCVGVAGGIKSAAGATGNITATQGTAATYCEMVIALEPI